MDSMKIDEVYNEEKILNKKLRYELDESLAQLSLIKDQNMHSEQIKHSYEIENKRLKDEAAHNEHIKYSYELENKRLKDEFAHNEHIKHSFELENKRLKDEFGQNEHFAHTYELENIRLKDENHELLQRIQDLQYDMKNSSNENKQVREENYRMKRSLDSMKEHYSIELSEKINKEVEIFQKELEEERNKYQNELQARNQIEINYHKLTEEDSKSLKQIEILCSDISNLQQEMKILKDENSLKISYEKESFHKQLSLKDAEIERISSSYHDLMIQFNRLAEENKIYRQSIEELEEKNKRLFENLEKELKARAHDYKERTLSMLATPIHEREGRRSISPVNRTTSPNIRLTTAQGMQTELISRTKLSESAQAKIGNTAARLLARMENDSALSNIRISSPSRRSPERPIPFKAHQVSREIRDILKSKMLEFRD